MSDYFENKDYKVDNLWFVCNGEKHYGSGLLHWDNKAGFKLEAEITYNQKKYATYSIPTLGLCPSCSIKMKINGYRYVVAPSVQITDYLRIKMDNILEEQIDRVIFIEDDRSVNENTIECLIKRHNAGFYPVNIKLDTNQLVYIPNGLFFEDVKRKVYTSLIDDKSIYLKYVFKQYPQKVTIFWFDALQYALSIIMGERIRIIHKVLYRGCSKYTVIKKLKETSDLSFLTLLGDKKYGNDIIFKLVDVFERDKVAFNICANIFEQTLSAAMQKNKQARELLISTILEGILRTKDGKPFIHGDKSWKFKKSWESFIQEYFKGNDKAWKPVFEKVKSTRESLRHRNAHPDWLWKDTGYYSEEQTEQSIDDLIFLCRFYGYIILAMAGYNDIKPDFPLPHKDWSPAITYTRAIEG